MILILILVFMLGALSGAFGVLYFQGSR